MAGGGRLKVNEIKALVRDGAVGDYWDGEGLRLKITGPARGRWIYKFRIAGTEKEFGIGKFSDVSLSEARALLADARALVAQGINPVTSRRLDKAAKATADLETVQALTDDWLESQKSVWSASHYSKAARALERDFLNSLGSLPVSAITPPMVAAALAPIEKRAPDSGSKLRQHVGLIFDHARLKGLRLDSPVVRLPGGSRSRAGQKKSQPAITSLMEIGPVLRRLDAITTHPALRVAALVLFHTAVRPGEVTAARWCEFDLDGNDLALGAHWRIPRARMKSPTDPTGGREDYITPVSAEMAEILRGWHAASGGAAGKAFVFPSTSKSSKSGHISIEGLEVLFRRPGGLGLAGRHVPHGCRSLFSTVCHNEVGADGRRMWDFEAVEHQLDHRAGSSVHRVYNRGVHWSQRRNLTSWWSKQLHAAYRGGVVIQLADSKRA
jgi:integrase